MKVKVGDTLVDSSAYILTKDGPEKVSTNKFFGNQKIILFGLHDAVYVSNHGGRQLDAAPAAIDVLPEIRQAVGGDYPLIFDSGLRSGEGIVKALALGADFVMLGRPFLYASGADGQRGVFRLVDMLKSELLLALAQIGCTDISHLDQNVLA